MTQRQCRQGFDGAETKRRAEGLAQTIERRTVLEFSVLDTRNRRVSNDYGYLHFLWK